MRAKTPKSTVHSSTFELDTKLGKPTMLEKPGANCEDSPCKFKADVAQQDASLADVLEKLEKPDAAPAPHSSLTPEMLVTSKKIYSALCMLVQRERISHQEEHRITERSLGVETAERAVQSVHQGKSDHEAHRNTAMGVWCRKRIPRQAHGMGVDHRGVGKLFAKTGTRLDQVSSICRESTRSTV